MNSGVKFGHALLCGNSARPISPRPKVSYAAGLRSTRIPGCSALSDFALISDTFCGPRCDRSWSAWDNRPDISTKSDAPASGIEALSAEGAVPAVD